MSEWKFRRTSTEKDHLRVSIYNKYLEGMTPANIAFRLGINLEDVEIIITRQKDIYEVAPKMWEMMLSEGIFRESKAEVSEKGVGVSHCFVKNDLHEEAGRHIKKCVNTRKFIGAVLDSIEYGGLTIDEARDLLLPKNSKGYTMASKIWKSGLNQSDPTLPNLGTNKFFVDE